MPAPHVVEHEPKLPQLPWTGQLAWMYPVPSPGEHACTSVLSPTHEKCFGHVRVRVLRPPGPHVTVHFVKGVQVP